jgi:hypothetical protein
VSLLDSLLWGRDREKVPQSPSPSSPSSPTHALSKTQKRKQPHFWGRYGDFYGWRAHLAVDAICAAAAPEGLIVWLREYSPSVYEQLTRDLPDRISRAWDARIPYEAFDALCFELVDAYRRAAELMLALR